MTLVLAALAVCAIIGALRGLIPKPRAVRERRAEATKRAVAEIKAMQAWSLVLGPATRARTSRFGGEPDLPAGTSWPAGPEEPMAFVGQFDLAAASEAGGPAWLPGDGMLFVFHHENWGYPDLVRVLYVQGRVEESKMPTRSPDGWAYPTRSINFERRTSLPSLEWLLMDGHDLEPAGPAWAELSVITDKRPMPKAHHQIGGFPEEIQPGHLPLDAELAWRREGGPSRKPRVYSPQEASKDWRLLLQIDTDEDLGMSWMDGGRLYVLIREQDARAGDFSQTVTIVQTY